MCDSFGKFLIFCSKGLFMTDDVPNPLVGLLYVISHIPDFFEPVLFLSRFSSTGSLSFRSVSIALYKGIRQWHYPVIHPQLVGEL